MKHILSIFIFTTFLLSDSLPVKTQDVSPQQLKKQNKQIVQLVAKEESKNLPQKVDKYTTITNIQAVDTSLVYTFEINTGAKSDEAIIKEDHSRMQKAITKGVCRSSKRFMDAQITKIFIYRSAVSKKELFRFTINQSKCLSI